MSATISQLQLRTQRVIDVVWMEGLHSSRPRIAISGRKWFGALSSRTRVTWLSLAATSSALRCVYLISIRGSLWPLISVT